MATTVRCPKCQRRNQIPTGAAAKARCGACGASLSSARGQALATPDRPNPGPSAVSPYDTGAGGGPASPGSPWGSGGPPGPGSPWGLGGPGGGPGGAGSPFGSGGGGDPSGARMRQARRTGRTASTSGRSSRLGGLPDDSGDPRSALLQRWNELLHLVPPDMGLTAALGESSDDPIAWLSHAAGLPRAELDEARKVRNNVASNRPVPDNVMSTALATIDRVLAVVGHMRLPE